MTRNFDRRVEAITPVDDVLLHPKLESLLSVCLSDNRNAWDLAADGSYAQRSPGDGEVCSAQDTFLREPWGTPVIVPHGASSEHGASPERPRVA